MKNRATYKILTLVGLVLPFAMNRMYLGEPFLLRLFTLNYFLIGAVTDLLYMDKRFDEAMARRGFMNTARRGNE